MSAAIIERWRGMPDSELRLRCGEMTAQEIRTVRAVLSAIAAEVNEGLKISENKQLTKKRYCEKL